MLFLLLGLVIGAISGLIGIGGGVLITPALIYFFGFSQYQAQGTTLALLVPPVGILAAWTYYAQGHVDVRVAMLICLGFLVGGWFGAQFSADLPEVLLRRIFATAMLVVGMRMLLTS